MVSEADRPHAMLVTDLAVGCHHFLQGVWFPSQLQSVNAALGWYQSILLVEQRHECV